MGLTDRAATRHDTVMESDVGGQLTGWVQAASAMDRQQYGKTAYSAQRRTHQQPHIPLSSKRPRRPLYKVLPPPLDMSEAAAAPAVATIPVECPGFDRCSSLQHCVSKDY